MFEDALMESGGRIRTQRGWFSGVAAVCNGSVVCLLLLWPLLHTASLPKQTLSVLLAAPAAPAQPLVPVARVVSAAPPPAALVNPFSPPLIVPNSIATSDREPPVMDMGTTLLAKEDGGNLNGLPASIAAAATPQVRVATPKKPAISSGVMEGHKLSGIDPRYPAIAIAAHVQGTVVLAATISRTGTIENLRVASGPPMLVLAAEEAVRTWRYRPYLLSGAPVEVETTIHVNFKLGG